MKKPYKFAKVLGVSVATETFNRANKMQANMNLLSLKVRNERFNMSDLGEMVWRIGLGVLEELNKNALTSVLESDENLSKAVSVEVARLRKAPRIAKSLGDVSDEQVEQWVDEAKEAATEND
jgi:hypothetical protein